MKTKDDLLANKRWIDKGLMYEQVFHSQTTYTESPSGKFAIEQILKGEQKRIWKASNPEQKLSKKKIVITDWSCVFYKHCDVPSLYFMLFQEGFSLYTWHNYQLEPVLNAENLRAALLSITPVNPQLLKSELNRLNISAEELYLADMKKSHELIKHFIDTNFLLEINWATIKYLPKAFQQELFDNAPQLPCLSFIINTEDLAGEGLPEQWWDQLATLTLDKDLEVANQEDNLKKIIQDSPVLKKITIHSAKEPILNFPLSSSIESVVINMDNDYPLDKFLSSCIHLKELIIQESFASFLMQTRMENIFINPSYISSLELFNVSSLALPSHFLVELLSKAVNLNCLRLYKCKITGEFQHPVHLFNALNTLTTDDTELPDELLNMILQNSPGLNTLRLYHFHQRASQLKQIISLPSSIEKLECYGLEIAWIELNRLLKPCSNLKQFEFIKHKLRTSDEEFHLLGEIPDNFTFPASLESLKWEGITINWAQMQKILQACNKLSQLDLMECHITGNLPDNFSLPVSLTKMKLIMIEVDTPVDLHLLSKNCPDLSLNLCVKDNGNISTYSSSFANNSVKELSFSANYSNKTQAMHLLQTCSQLKRAILYENSILEQYKPDFNLPNTLEVLYTGSTAWSNIQNLLQNESRIKTLYIENPTMEQLLFNLSLPSSLEELRFTDLDVEGLEFISHCLQTLIRLKTLSIKLDGEHHGSVFPACFSFPKSLCSLSIGADVQWGTIQNIAQSCPDIKYLTLNVNEQEPTSLQFSFPKLKSLKLRNTSVTWEVLHCLLQNCPQLERLDLRDSTHLEHQLPPFFILPSTLRQLVIDQTGIPLNILDQFKRNNADLMISGDPGCVEYSQPIYAPDYHSSSASMALDANTEEVSPLNVRTIFKFKNNMTQDVMLYRLDIYSTIEQSTKKLVQRSPQVDIQTLRTYHSTSNLEQKFEEFDTQLPYALGQIQLENAQEWIGLPSLTCNDAIAPEHIEIIPAQPFYLIYDAHDSRYFLQLQQNSVTPVSISFIVTVKSPPLAVLPSVPDALIEANFKKLAFSADGTLSVSQSWRDWFVQNNGLSLLLGYCSNFKAKALESEASTTIELLNFIINQQAGHCRHRSHAFMALASALGFQCRYVSNDCHAFVEVYGMDRWVHINLGGTNAPLNIMPFPGVVLQPEEDAHMEQEQEVLVNTSTLVQQFSPSNRYRTWDTHSSQSTTLTEYAHELVHLGQKLQPGKRNVLCILEQGQIDGLHHVLLDQTKKDQKQLLFIDDLNQTDLQQLSVNNANGSYTKVDSPLAAFLKSATAGDVLLMNWSEYEAPHIGFNTVIDKERSFKQLPIAPGVIVINLLRHDKTAHMGEDFYSRCRVTSSMPRALTAPECTVAKYTPKWFLEPKELCFYDTDWESMVTGTLQLKQTGFQLEPSAWIDALENNEAKNLVLRNAPWHLLSFRSFIRQIQSQEYLQINGVKYSLKHITLYRDDTPYDLSKAPLVKTPAPIKTQHCLNSSVYHTFFQQYQVQKDTLLSKPGVLHEYRNMAINILLTGELENGQWQKLFVCAAQKQVQLHIEAAPGVSIPDQLQPLITTVRLQQRAWVCHSNDSGYTLLKHQEYFIIPVTAKTTRADLLETIDCTDRNGTLVFHQEDKILAKALLKGKKVILCGTLSDTLKEELASLFLDAPYMLLNGVHRVCNKPLNFVSEAPTPLDFVASHQQLSTMEQRWEALGTCYPQNLDVIEQLKTAVDYFLDRSGHPPFNYTQLKSMLDRLLWKFDANPLKHLLRLHPDYTTYKPLLDAIGFKLLQKDANWSRLDKVLTELMHSHYTVIMGGSGVGKSHFVQKELAQYFEIVEGWDKLEHFLTPNPTTSRPKCWFLDEANLVAPEQLELFQGLLHQPPQLLFKGEFHPLPPGYKVIFAGNDGHFHGRRHAPFFANHGHIQRFKPMSEEQLYNKVVQPLVAVLFPQKPVQAKLVGRMALTIYQKYTQSHGLTARNLEMIMLRSMVIPNLTWPYRLCMAAADELAPKFTSEERAAFRQWCEEQHFVAEGFLNQGKKQLKRQYSTLSEGFLLTASRKNPVRLLDNLMSVRDYKLNHPQLQQKGTPAMLIEGDPGIGKSLLVMAYLESKGYVKDTSYYYLTPAFGYECIEKVLQRAFHEGAIVIIDELNTLPLERLLNAMLSGVDLQGHAAQKPGFTLIATQNPVTYAKRQVLSDALLNRFQVLKLKNYPQEELLEIMIALTKNHEKSHFLVQEFVTALHFANTNNLHPKPSPRNLFADAVRGGNEDMEMEHHPFR